jgi:mono/diheme cytochrome c family protein
VLSRVLPIPIVSGLAWLFVAVLPCVLDGLGGVHTYAQEASPNLAQPERIAAGAVVFARHCARSACHGGGGRGGGAPVLRGRVWSPGRLWKIIHDASGVALMPPLGDRLSDEEIWAVIAYVLSISAQAGASSPSP